MVKTRLVPSQPALILEDIQRYLVITDLHIGFEMNMISNDINIRPDDIIKEAHHVLETLIKSEKPDNLIILGDVKSGTDSISKIEWQMVPKFFEIGKKINTLVIPGNHDGNLARLVPDYITMASPSGLVIGDTLLTHGHVMPSENFSHINKILMGHLHPVYFQEGSVLDGQRLWISVRTEKRHIFPSSKGDLEILIMPSFNRYFYATHKRYSKKSISPILERIKKSYSAKVITLDGSIIGDENSVSSIF